MKLSAYWIEQHKGHSLISGTGVCVLDYRSKLPNVCCQTTSIYCIISEQYYILLHMYKNSWYLKGLFQWVIWLVPRRRYINIWWTRKTPSYLWLTGNKFSSSNTGTNPPLSIEPLSLRLISSISSPKHNGVASVIPSFPREFRIHLQSRPTQAFIHTRMIPQWRCHHKTFHQPLGIHLTISVTLESFQQWTTATNFQPMSNHVIL